MMENARAEYASESLKKRVETTLDAYSGNRRLFEGPFWP